MTAAERGRRVAILGAGQGGISCATKAASLGAQVLLIEPGAVGGT